MPLFIVTGVARTLHAPEAVMIAVVLALVVAVTVKRGVVSRGGRSAGEG